MLLGESVDVRLCVLLGETVLLGDAGIVLDDVMLLVCVLDGVGD